ncbi:MAG: LPS assembly protein LptD [Gammaproteobacteria bacterium]|nr:LPS assembly protein LptD [Gammaproteobacteria bacterium]
MAEAEQSGQTNSLLCPKIESSANKYSPPDSFAIDKQQETRISAQQVENLSGDSTRFTGDVQIDRHLLRLQADEINYQRKTETITLSKNIHIDANNLAIDADSGWYNMSDNTGEFSNTQYRIINPYFQGQSPALIFESKNITRLESSSFSSCPPGNRDWELKSSSLTLDTESQTGSATNTTIWFKGFPLFYTPYISFPLGDQRRSGFLMPSFGNSNRNGTEISIPWYWNIAPNQDMLLTPTNMVKRGQLLDTKYRYLSQDSMGNIDLAYLDNDQLTDTERYFLNFKHHTDLGSKVDLDLDIKDASDPDYLYDFGGAQDSTSLSHLERKANIAYNQGPWKLNLMAQTFETIDEDITLASRPYRRLPQLTLTGTDQLGSSDLSWSVESEWVDFEHESDSRITGQRMDIYPKVSWPLLGNAWFLTPSFGYRYTRYDVLDDTDTPLDIEDRRLSVTSLDSGLFFERYSQNGRYLQTLEPRLFYLKVPYHDQSTQPIFDTGNLDFTFAQLFRDNRFSGIDRIGDADQLTLGLTSRLLDADNGNELMSFSIGQIHYFEDRLVSLDSTTVETQKSDIIAEISGSLNNWTARGTAQYNPELNQTDKRSVQLHYQRDKHQIFNVGYRFRRDLADETQNLEQTDISLVIPLAKRYRLLARRNYSMTESREIESLYGIEYESCCWAIRLIAQSSLLEDEPETTYDRSIKLQLVLKGLGSTDKSATDSLTHAILGYQPDY